jgi:hypothetical protein
MRMTLLTHKWSSVSARNIDESTSNLIVMRTPNYISKLFILHKTVLTLFSPQQHKSLRSVGRTITIHIFTMYCTIAKLICCVLIVAANKSIFPKLIIIVGAFDFAPPVSNGSSIGMAANSDLDRRDFRFVRSRNERITVAAHILIPQLIMVRNFFARTSSTSKTFT